MKTNKLVTLIAMLVLCINGALADGAKSLRLSEVAIGDSTTKGAWIEIQNTSWGTQNLGGFYITNDPSALDPNLSAPERIKKMRLIPTGNPATAITPQNCLLLYADGQENLGIQHLKFTLHPGDIVAIYSGNGVSLIDSVAIPADIGPSQSFARDFDKDSWSICRTPTPTRDNSYAKKLSMSKISDFKEKDPYGIAMSILAMGVVFGCLILLYVFFTIFGKIAKIINENTTTSTMQPRPILYGKNKSHKVGHNAKEEEIAAIMAVTQATSGSGDESLDAALIALTLEAECAHDEESGIITIKDSHSDWADKACIIEAGMLKQ